MSEPRVAGHVRCTHCEQSRFFVYVVDGEAEITCAGCGVRYYRITDAANWSGPKEKP